MMWNQQQDCHIHGCSWKLQHESIMHWLPEVKKTIYAKVHRVQQPGTKLMSSSDSYLLEWLPTEMMLGRKLEALVAQQDWKEGNKKNCGCGKQVSWSEHQRQKCSYLSISICKTEENKLALLCCFRVHQNTELTRNTVSQAKLWIQTKYLRSAPLLELLLSLASLLSSGRWFSHALTAVMDLWW